LMYPTGEANELLQLYQQRRSLSHGQDAVRKGYEEQDKERLKGKTL